MEGFEGNPGTSRLASVLSGRIKKETTSPLTLDFGEIQPGGCLVTNTFPVPIPRGDYSVCRHAGGFHFAVSGGGHEGHEGPAQTLLTGEHTHIIEPPPVQPGDRVLVAWVQNEAVVVDVIVKS